jgi:hypothetical protein
MTTMTAPASAIAAKMRAKALVRFSMGLGRETVGEALIV